MSTDERMIGDIGVRTQRADGYCRGVCGDLLPREIAYIDNVQRSLDAELHQVEQRRATGERHRSRLLQELQSGLCILSAMVLERKHFELPRRLHRQCYGVIWLILAALIVSQHHHANSMGNVTVAVGFLRFHFLSPTPTKFLPGISPPKP